MTNNPTIHKTLITTGCLMWCVSFFGEIYGAQPYSTFGIIISPILTIVGVLYWFKYYRATRRHYPKFKTVRDNIQRLPKAGYHYTLNFDFFLKHIPECLTFCILVVMGVFVIMFATFRNSGAFQATKQYCSTNQEILSQTGNIQYFGTLVRGRISLHGQGGGSANLSFNIVGTEKNKRADAKLTKENGVWTVENVKLQEW